jgi:GAF domain-containing protein
MRLSAKIQKMIKDLEQEVLDRTKAQEKRAVQLRAAADVGKAITSVRVLSELLQQTTLLISERFGYYHVGIFLLDERKEFAVLSASNSEGGRRMLERNHRLKVGETGIVGYVTANARARIALDVGQDAVFFDNPDLPNTRSEMALPMVVSGRILGALDVQSTEPQAFNEEDIATLQILAEQIAVAIQNVNLLNETENALAAAREVYGEISREAWRRILRYQQRVGYLATSPGAIPTQSETMDPNMSKAFETGDIVFGSDGLTIILPVKVRGESVGAIRMKKSEISEAWSQDETNLAIALTDQLSGALESARLYRASQQIAARQSLVSDISARISASSRVENVIKETVQELGQILGNSKITFQVRSLPGGAEQADAPARSVVKSRGNGGSRE